MISKRIATRITATTQAAKPPDEVLTVIEEEEGEPMQAEVPEIQKSRKEEQHWVAQTPLEEQLS